MISRDYTQEVGIPSQKKKLSRPLTIILLAIIAVGICFGVAGVIAQTKAHHAAEQGKAAPASQSAPAAAP
jgi:hypothetical protein